MDQQWHWDSLERIFIEERIYRRIEKSKTWESVLEEIRAGLQPFLRSLRRPVTADDLARLTEIKIKRISAYNRFQADEAIARIEAEMKTVKHDLKHLVAYAVRWFETLAAKYGKGIKRRTEYEDIEQISAAAVVSANQRLYVNRSEGFIGLNWRQHEFVQECSILDEVVCFMADGTMKVTRVADKVFMGRDILFCAVLPKEGDPGAYAMVYQDGASGKAFAKKFQIGGVTRDKLYPLAEVRGLAGGLFRAFRGRGRPAQDAPRRARWPEPGAGPGVRLRLHQGPGQQSRGEGADGLALAGEGGHAGCGDLTPAVAAIFRSSHCA